MATKSLNLERRLERGQEAENVVKDTVGAETCLLS